MESLQCLRLCTVFKVGNIVEYMSQPNERSILITSDCKTYLLSASPTTNTAGVKLNNLVAVEFQPNSQGERVTKLVYLDDQSANALAVETRTEG
jgi:hypothetical protein